MKDTLNSTELLFDVRVKIGIVKNSKLFYFFKVDLNRAKCIICADVLDYTSITLEAVLKSRIRNRNGVL